MLELQALQAAHPSDEVEVWSQDEARFGLKPVLRRVWSPSGERPLAEIEVRYEWLWLVLPRLDTGCVQAFLDEFAKEHAPTGKRILLVWDGAPAHRATALQAPGRISVISLPAYTPELNPSERVWPLVKEGVANRAHESLDELEQKVCSRCQKISAADISARTNYHWWPEL